MRGVPDYDADRYSLVDMMGQKSKLITPGAHRTNNFMIAS